MDNKSLYNNIEETLTIGEVVANNYRMAEVFKKFDIDFCCGGGKALVQTCEENGVDVAVMAEALREVEQRGKHVDYDFENWELGQLIDHIQEAHHTYVKESIPVISEYAEKVKSVHGQNKPYVNDIADHFLALAEDLMAHLQKEENILFPFIKEMELAKVAGESIQTPFGSVQNPISAMFQEHDMAGDELKVIRKLADSFMAPVDACATHMVLYGMLKDFESDLMMHIHLENNILFPKAIALENDMTNL